MTERLLIIEDHPLLLDLHLAQLRDTAPAIVWERTRWHSLRPEHLRECKADLVIPVAVPPSSHAADFFDWLKDNPIPVPTLAILPDAGDSELFGAALQVADDFVVAPVRGGEFGYRLRRILGGPRTELAQARARLAQELGLGQLVGKDEAFIKVVEKIPLVARSRTPVLITGETGTGKELCARAIHHLSSRREYPFVPVDCAAFPDHLFENEVFGHARGAFTDAHRDQKGLVALAEKGTLFLDEVDSLSLAAQAKLLRFLQERTFKPLGSDRFLRAEVEVLAATNQDLEQMVKAREFRADLFFRLSVLRLHMVPLRERRSDIAILAQHFLRTACAQSGAPHKTLAAATMHKLDSYDWPGNVRELNNVIQSAVVFSQGEQILPHHITTPDPQTPAETENDGFRQTRARALEAFERRYVEDLMRQCGGNVTRAACLAKKDRRAFGRLVKRYDIRRKLL